MGIDRAKRHFEYLTVKQWRHPSTSCPIDSTAPSMASLLGWQRSTKCRRRNDFPPGKHAYNAVIALARRQLGAVFDFLTWLIGFFSCFDFP